MTATCALYRMEHNHYLGDCLAIIYRPTPTEIATDHLQSPLVLALVKSWADLSVVRTPEDVTTQDLFDRSKPILLRIGSACLFGVFGDSHCECELQRVTSLREIACVGQGLYIHLPQEAQGNGLYYKAQELQLQVSGLDPDGNFVGEKSVQDAASFLLGSECLEKRSYNSVRSLFALTALNRYTYELISDSPGKEAFLRDELGLTISGVRSVGRLVTLDNAGEYLGKLYTKGYSLTDRELESIYLAIFQADTIPPRVLSLLRDMAEDLRDGRKFPANAELLEKIVKIPKARGIRSDAGEAASGFDDGKTYVECQVELVVSRDDVDLLFDKGILLGLESVQYEENHFYDLAYFRRVPARSLKIRYAYYVRDQVRATPLECKFIYKVPVGDKTYRIRAVAITDAEIAKLLDVVLRDRERHLLPVFTHNVGVGDSRLTVLIKRYTRDLRTLSLMGDEAAVEAFAEKIRQWITAPEVADPSNYRFLKPNLSLDFDYDVLSAEEIDLFKKHFNG